MKVVFWLSSLDEHQVHTLREFELSVGERVSFVVARRELPQRRAQGWSLSDLDDLEVQEIPMHNWLRFCVAHLKSNADAIHVFGGMWGERRFPMIIGLARVMRIRTGLISEPYADSVVSYYRQASGWGDAIRMSLRWLLYRTLGKMIVRSMSAVFPISKKAIRQFKSMGCAEQKIFPFGYFVPLLSMEERRKGGGHDGQLRLIFVGSLIERKGLGILKKSLDSCDGAGVTLDIYGPGSWNAVKWGGANISYKGVIPFGETQRVVSGYDVMVLPSLHDGWGVVVNEALLQGVPAIVSDAVGASVLIEKSKAGAVFHAGEHVDLAAIIISLIADQELLREWQASALSFRSAIKPSRAACYLHKCLCYTSGDELIKPIAPWYGET